MKKFFSIILSLTIIIVSALSINTFVYADVNLNSNDIVILYTNDVHCSVSKTDSSMGIDDIAGYKEYVKGKTNNVSLVDNGDFIQGAPMGTLSRGEMLIDIMNEAEYDICTYGNHEFDYGIPQLKKTCFKSQCKIYILQFFQLKN